MLTSSPPIGSQVWDHVELVESIFTEWRGTLWPSVNVDSMVIQTNKVAFAYTIHPLQ